MMFRRNVISRVFTMLCVAGLMAAFGAPAQAQERVSSKVYASGSKPEWGAGGVRNEGQVYFLRIESDNAGRETVARERMAIPEGLRGKHVTLFAYVLATDIAQASPPQNTAKILITREGPGKKALGYGVMHPKTDGQWQTVSWSKKLEDNVESLQVGMGLYKCTGRMDVRALVLLEGEHKEFDWNQLKLPAPSDVPATEATRNLPQEDRIDVTAEPFKADPTGKQDSTAAIQKAIDHAVYQLEALKTGLTRTQQVLYFPAGTYLVSDKLTLRADKGDDVRASEISFIGDGPGKTTLRLSDKNPKFQEGRVPVLVFLEGSRSNIAHQNEVIDLTIDVGVGNPGAVALDFISNNVGTIRRVVLRSSDPNGAGDTGLQLRRQLGGQALIHHLEVHGFKIGIDIRHPISAYTFEDVLLQNQQEVGLINDRKAVAIHRLRSVNRVPAIVNTNSEGLITVLSAELTGGGPDAPAIDNQAGGLVLRDVKIDGYGVAVNNRGKTVSRLPEGVWSSHEPVGIGEMPKFLPVKDAPNVPVADEANTFRVDTAYIDSFTKSNEGATEADAVQAALDSGKADIVFERRRYSFTKSVTVRGNVRRLDLNYAAVRPSEDPMQTQGQPLFILEDTAQPLLVLEKFSYNFSHGFRFYHIQNNRNQTLLIRDSMFAVGSHIYRNTGTGDLFLENVFSIFRVDNHHAGMKKAPEKDLPGEPAWVFRNQNVWARQFNVESDTRGYGELLRVHTVVDGGNFWVMGYKCGEFDGPYLGVKNGGRLEFWGGFVNTIGSQPVDARAMFVNDGGSMIISGVERSSNEINHPIVLKHADGAKVLHADFPHRRGEGILFPLIFSSFSP